MNEGIRNIVFDIGEVLFSYRWKNMLMDYGLDEKTAERVGDEMFNDPEQIWHIFDLGIKSDEEIIKALSDKHPEDAEAIRWFISHPEYMHVPRPAVWRLVHALKERGYGIFLLSNYPEYFYKVHTEYADFMHDIDGAMVSYMIKKSKPDEAIYDALCKKYDLNPKESIFFDDREENVKGAINYGMKSIQIKSQEQLITELEKFLQ
ncbi:MAG: HAD family phosphatase [Lachnospiraceae bacterium]|nr:HAD family phosphatase [Lachnospiraceae bacterium]